MFTESFWVMSLCLNDQQVLQVFPLFGIIKFSLATDDMMDVIIDNIRTWVCEL